MVRFMGQSTLEEGDPQGGKCDVLSVFPLYLESNCLRYLVAIEEA